jgi:transposase
VAVPIEAATPTATSRSPATALMCLQARLPNGVVLDLHEVDLRHAGDVIEALGRIRCSASTKP